MLKIQNLVIAISGCLAVVIFSVALYIGGYTIPYYSQLSHEISVLFSASSPSREFLTPFLFLYISLLSIFSWALFFKSEHLLVKMGAFCIFLKAIASLGVWLFPMDHIGPPLTAQGASHLFFVGMIALSVTFGMIFLGIAFRKMRNMYWLYPLSLLLAIFLCTSALWGVLTVMTRNIFLGFYERLPFITFFIWIILLSYGILSSDRRIKHYFTFSKFRSSGAVK